MKISKFEALKILSKHLLKKFIKDPSIKVDTSLVATSLSIMLNVHVPKLKQAGIIDNDDRVDVSILEKELIKIFNVSPILNLPLGNATISITKADALAFIDELDRNSEIDKAIVLPYHN